MNDIERKKAIAGAIKNCRKSAGLSQKDLAEAIGSNRVSISRYETADQRPSFDVLCKIAKALKVNVSDLDPLIGKYDTAALGAIAIPVTSFEIGTTIETLRTDAGLSIAELAQKTGIDEEYLSLVEKGSLLADADFLDAIAKALDVPTTKLYGKHSYKEWQRKEDEKMFRFVSGRFLDQFGSMNIEAAKERRVISFSYKDADKIEITYEDQKDLYYRMEQFFDFIALQLVEEKYKQRSREV